MIWRSRTSPCVVSVHLYIFQAGRFSPTPQRKLVHFIAHEPSRPGSMLWSCVTPRSDSARMLHKLLFRPGGISGLANRGRRFSGQCTPGKIDARSGAGGVRACRRRYARAGEDRLAELLLCMALRKLRGVGAARKIGCLSCVYASWRAGGGYSKRPPASQTPNGVDDIRAVSRQGRQN